MPADQRRGPGDQQHGADDAGCEALGELRRARALRQAVLYHAADLLDGGAFTRLGHSHDDPLIAVHRARDDLVSGTAQHRVGLARQERFVEAGAPLHDQAIRRDLLARKRAHQIAGAEVHHRHALPVVGAGPFAPGHGGHGHRQPVESVCGPDAAPRLPMPGEQHEEDEHRDGVEIDLAAPGRRGVQAAEEGQGERKGDGNVHAEAPVAQVCPGADPEVLRGVDEERQAHEQARPAPDADPQRQGARRIGAAHEVGGEGKMHHRHAESAREDQALNAAATARLAQTLAMGCVIGMGDVADLGDGTQNLAQAHPVGVPADPHALSGAVDADVEDARLATQVTLVQPQAGRATDVLQEQRGLAPKSGLTHEAALDLGAIEDREPFQDFGQVPALRAGVAVGAMAVIVLQACVDDRLAHLPAAGAAEGALLAEHPQTRGRPPAGDLEPAVEAGRCPRLLLADVGLSPGQAGHGAAPETLRPPRPRCRSG